MKSTLTTLLLFCALALTAQTTTRYTYDNLNRLTKVEYTGEKSSGSEGSIIGNVYCLNYYKI